jgi:hypothetical protein
MPLPGVERNYDKGQRRHQAIAERALRKWWDAGKPEGRDLDFWLDAEWEIVEEEVRRDLSRIHSIRR